MNDPFYEEDTIIPEKVIHEYHPRSVGEIFSHMREKLEKYYDKDNIFDADYQRDKIDRDIIKIEDLI